MVCSGMTYNLKEPYDKYNPREPYKIIGESYAIQKLLASIAKVAPSNAVVLVQGEVGTGKKLAAYNVYAQSKRYGQRYEFLHCGSVHDELIHSILYGHEKGAFTGATKKTGGYFTELDGGTLILDEISLASPKLQTALLGFLEEGEYTPVGDTRRKRSDIRIIAVTNQSLEGMVAERSFREDLLSRLKVCSLTVPPLRNRIGDIRMLANYFIGMYSLEENNYELIKKNRDGIPDEVLSYLMGLEFPGNIRDLKNLMHNAVIYGDFNHLGDFAEEGGGDGIVVDEEGELKSHNLLYMAYVLGLCQGKALKAIEALKAGRATLYRKMGGLVGNPGSQTLREREKEHVLQVLDECGGNHTQAAERLGISRNTLWRKLKGYGVESENS